MGRTIYAEEQIKDYINGLYGSDRFIVGLIVGQQSISSKDHAILLVPTPHPDEDKSVSPDAIIDEQWIVQHFKQVSRMMPGGINVIGIFVFTSPNIMNTIKAQLRQTTFACQKSFKKQQIVKMGDKITERIMLHICAVTRKVICRSVDVADPNSTIKPADWKYQSSLNRWPQMTSVLRVDLTIPIAKTTGKSDLLKQFHRGLAPLCTSIHQSMSTVNGQLSTGSDPLDKQQSKSKSSMRNTGTNTTSRQLFQVDLLSNMVCDSYQVTKSTCGACFHLQGCIQCHAYVNNKATVYDAVQALKDDAIRSLQARCDLLLEELEQDQQDTEGNKPAGISRINITPRRVFTPIPGTSVSVSDYMFPDETASDCLERFSEILSITTTEDMLDLTSEVVPDVESIVEETVKETDIKEASRVNNPNHDRSTSKSLMAVVVGLSGAVVAALMSYLTLASD